ncbi:peptidase, partial [Pseudomonas sp. FW306-2-11AD]
ITTDGYRIVSDNPAYPAITAASVDVIGRVVWLSRTLR